MISVVIPLYNKASSVAQTLESVLAQTCPPDEIIVIDDGSTDNGSDVVERFIESGVRLIKQSNQGVSSARNRGLEEASSPYVAFLDADDYWLPEHLETAIDLLKQWPEACLVSTSHFIKRDGHMFAARSGLQDGWVGVVDNFFECFANGLSLVNSSTACVNRDALLNQGGFPVGVKRGEDIIAWTRLALSGVVVHKAVRTAVYNQQAGNHSAELREHAPPGSLIYLSQLLLDHSLDSITRRKVALLFDKISLMTAAGFFLAGDVVGTKAIAELAAQVRRWKVALQIRLITILPFSLLSFFRRLRHRRVA